MKYYGWGGKEDGKLEFIVQKIKKIKGKSRFHKGWIVGDMGKEVYTSYKKMQPGSEIDVEIDTLNVFDNLRDAMRETIRGLFREA